MYEEIYELGTNWEDKGTDFEPTLQPPGPGRHHCLIIYFVDDYIVAESGHMEGNVDGDVEAADFLWRLRVQVVQLRPPDCAHVDSFRGDAVCLSLWLQKVSVENQPQFPPHLPAQGSGQSRWPIAV